MSDYLTPYGFIPGPDGHNTGQVERGSRMSSKNTNS